MKTIAQPRTNTQQPIPFGPGHPLYDPPRYGGQIQQPTNTAGPPPGQIPTTPYGDPTPPTGGTVPGTLPWGPTTTPTTTIPPPGEQAYPNPRPNTPGSSGGGGFGTSTNPNGGVPTGQTGGQGGQAGSGNIQTSITPLLTYPEELTETARNQIVATQAQASDPRWLTKRFASPGRSIDAGTAAAAMPFLAQGQFLGNQGWANLSMGDFLANQESLLAGEIAREKEGLGLGNLLARLNEGQIQNQNQLLSPLLGSLLR